MLTEVPGSVKVPPSLVWFVTVSSPLFWKPGRVVLKRLPDEFFASLPERLSSVRIERILAHTFAYGVDGHVIRNDLADVAVLAVSAADLVSWSNDTGPHRGCGSLRNRLQLEGRLTLCRKLLIHLLNPFLKFAQIDLTTQFRMYGSWMHSCGAYTMLPVPVVEGNREQDVCRLRSAIRDKGFIWSPLKIGIFQVDIGVAVTRRRQIDQPPSRADERRNLVDEHKVAQVISAELRLKAVRRMAKGRGHHSGIGDDHVEGVASCE